ncbi:MULTISPECIES: hypothetical protein [Haloferax]|uniref:Uncharacterized protein n=2 Tax=Haloferax TaxID=2251 RepID=A0A6G1Z2N3_9EURY|nr:MULTISPECIES: hypothetical protein [Haloferax]KAB1188002.1 hypothetical protein Hfx1149_08130 [Haloferax sp. CBA1149]MRW80671.1 hypothetical protein [Haloferax marinisediminis]
MARKSLLRVVVVGVFVLASVAGGTGSVVAVGTGSDDCDDTDREIKPSCARDENRATAKDVLSRAGKSLGETPNGDKVIRILKKKLPS